MPPGPPGPPKPRPPNPGCASADEVKHKARIARALQLVRGARHRNGGIRDSGETRNDPNAASTQGNSSSPLGRKPIAHGASRGNEPRAEQTPEGAEEGRAATFAP